jgi:hypothetical protein
LPYSDPIAATLLEAIPVEQRTETWRLVLRDGRIIPGHPGGGVALMKEVRLMRWLGRLLTALRLSGFIDAVDVYFAHARSWCSRFVPEGKGPWRYP